MFSTFLQEVRGYLGKGFLLSVFIPTLIFASAHAAIYLELSLGLGVAWRRWATFSTEAKAMLILAALISLTFFAYVIHNLQLGITRLFEGYWDSWVLSRLKQNRLAYYKQEWDYYSTRVKRLTQDVQAAPQNRQLRAELAGALNYWINFFPPTGRDLVQPTRLGNVLRAGERYAYDRYRIDSVVIWPRLRPLVQGSLVETLQDKKIAVDFMLLMTLYCILFALIWCPVLAIWTNRWLLFLLCGAGLPLAWICYQIAVHSAVAYSGQIRTVFDLHRYDLLNAMGLKVPLDFDQERDLWRDLSLFFQNNIEPTSVYQRAISPDETHKYLMPDPSPQVELEGWARIQQAMHELLQGVAEVLKSDDKT